MNDFLKKRFEQHYSTINKSFPQEDQNNVCLDDLDINLIQGIINQNQTKDENKQRFNRLKRFFSLQGVNGVRG